MTCLLSLTLGTCKSEPTVSGPGPYSSVPPWLGSPQNTHVQIRAVKGDNVCGMSLKTRCFPHVTLFNLIFVSALKGKDNLFYFTNEAAKAQRGEVNCLRSHSQDVLISHLCVETPLLSSTCSEDKFKLLATAHVLLCDPASPTLLSSSSLLKPSCASLAPLGLSTCCPFAWYSLLSPSFSGYFLASP